MTRSGSGGKTRPAFLLGLAASVAIPALLAVLFWRTTPTVGGWGEVLPRGTPPAAAGDAPLRTGARLYEIHCGNCHGAALEGSGLGPALRKSHWSLASDPDLLAAVIREGRGANMPAFDGRLTPEQIGELVRFLQLENGIRAPA